MGHTTSGCYSPLLDSALAMASVPPMFAVPGTELKVVMMTMMMTVKIMMMTVMMTIEIMMMAVMMTIVIMLMTMTFLPCSPCPALSLHFKP